MIIITEKDDRIEYEKDAANYIGEADRIYLPESTDELSQLIKDLSKEQIPITISAARTGLTGGGVSHEGIVISTERLDEIISIDKQKMTAILEPGVRLQNFHDELKQHGLFYPSNPTEIWSTIGGNVANNASGAKTYKYGATRGFVNYLEVILPNGDEVHLYRGQSIADGNKAKLESISGNVIEFDIPLVHQPNITKNAAGIYLKANMDLIDLFIGSEGTLGVIKKIGLNLLKAPESVVSAIFFLDDYQSTLKLVSFLRNTKKIEPRLIEYFDHNSLKLLSKHQSNIPNSAKAAIWIEVETTESEVENIMGEVYEISLENGALADETWIAVTDKDRKRITEFRHNLPLSVNELLTKYGQRKIYTDTSVPVEYFNNYFNKMYDKLNELELDYVVFGHIGDCHLHANLFVKSEEEKQKAEYFYNYMVDDAIENNGTFSAEHGVGKIKRPFMKRMYSKEELVGMRKVKEVFDPSHLFGRDTIFLYREL